MHTLKAFGLEIRPERLRPMAEIRADHLDLTDESFWRVVAEVWPCTQLNIHTLWNLYDAVRHVVTRPIEGALVECGILLGGSAMALLRTLLLNDASQRDVWLYDSFRLFTGPASEDDIAFAGHRVEGVMPSFEAAARENVDSIGYPQARLRWIVGNVEDTVTRQAPDRIALLRLDTDTYHSTRAELAALWPRLVPGGLLIIDDYGYARGARRAVEEHFAEFGPRPFLARVSHGCRLVVKQG